MVYERGGEGRGEGKGGKKNKRERKILQGFYFFQSLFNVRAFRPSFLINCWISVVATVQSPLSLFFGISFDS